MKPGSLVWITGAGGLVGAALLRQAPSFAQVVGLTRENIDLTDFPAVEKRFLAEKPALVIHCAALSRSPECQSQPALAKKINTDLVNLLAGLARDLPFIFFSTDQAFDGQKGAYVETDVPNPLSIYAETKVAAEENVKKNPRHTIIRLALCGGISPRGRNAFNEELAHAWRSGAVPKFFQDEFRSPLAAPVAARAVWELAASGAPGIFHLAGARRMSRLEIGQAVAARHPELSPRFEAGSLRDYRGAPRAPDTSLCCEKIQTHLSFPLPGLDDWLRDHPGEPF